MHIEKEIKLLINLQKVKEILNNPTFKLEKSGFQRTTRRDTEDLTFEKQNTFIRTREDNKNIITVKRKTHNNTEVFEREEFETEIDDIEVMNSILEILGLTKTWIMEKYRIQGQYDNVTITLDELPFGIYMEIEGEEEDIVEVANQLGLNLEGKITVTYWDLWDAYKAEHNIDPQIENIVFENDEYILETLI